ncbi:hypothetical protein WH47_00163 [Habropoda laboriosa]|uniref:Generative cell specific-1/HAP2 domain-containing protein n=1 Tax=Habropoda laboriosa TaxID=597456 RepID=A0A0L7R1B3_9HYME|nr:hypothetical protein WH47_00163 [Habropoda laboriosa]
MSTTTRSPYVSEFDYVPRFHPSRNPDCASRFLRDRRFHEDLAGWDRPSIEIRAVLSGCSRFEEKTIGEDFHVRRKRRYEDLNRISNCTRKIVISMRFNNIGKTEIQEKFVVIDHVLDPSTKRKIALQSPYVIKVRQEPILQMYGLKFQSVVNAEAKEEVINNRNRNFEGCFADSDKPTCGQSFVRGEPVPFSQGFCCSCDSGANGGQRNESSRAKSNYKAATNSPGNRLQTGDVSSDDNSMARRQPEGNEIQSEKKPNVSHVNLTCDRTIRTDISLFESVRDGNRQSKLSNEISSKETCLEKEKENREKSQESGNSVSSNFVKMNVINREKYGKKQTDRWWTSSSSLSPEVAAGRTPSGDETASNVDVGQDRASVRKTGCLLAVERIRNPANEPNSKNAGSVAKNEICVKKIGRNRCGIAPNGRIGSNRGFHSIDSIADVKKVCRVSADRGIRWKNQLSRSEDPFRSTKHEYGGKLTEERRRKKVSNGNDVKGTRRREHGERWPESLHGNKGAPPVKSAKKRDKVFLVPVTIDSQAIRPPMHLNEPLKNSSTGVSNGNRSPFGRTGSSVGNLNGVMENTSQSGEIIGGTFNEKHGADVPSRGYAESNGNEQGKSSRAATLNEARRKKGFRGGTSRKNDLSANREMIKNYTPQKRTLKDVSYRKREQRGGERRKRHGVVACHGGSKKNFRRTRRHLRRRKNSLSRRRSRRFDRKHGGGRGKRSKKLGEDKGPNQNPGHDVQVYIDNSKTLGERMSEKSRSSKLAHGENAETGKGGRVDGKDGDSIWRNEANRQDNVDKQIEEKFSRISDALKEDTIGSKAIMDDKRMDTADVNPVNEKEESSNDVAEVQNKLEQLDTAPSYRRGEENRKANGNEVTAAIKINENIDDVDGKLPSYQAGVLDVNQGGYTNSRDEGKYEQVLSNSRENKPFDLGELLDEYKTSTSSYDLVISPTMGSFENKEENQVTSNIFTPENIDKMQFSAQSTTDVGQLTRAVIVVDFFKIATDSLTTFTDAPESTGTQPKLTDRLGGLKKNIEQAFMQLKPVSRTTGITESTTMMLMELTTKNSTTEATTSAETTKITGQGFRVSIRPTESATQASGGGAEIHHEVIIDGLTFPDETPKSIPQTRSFLSPNSISGNSRTSKVKRKSRMSDRRRKKRRTTPSMIKKQDSKLLGSLRRGVPGDYEGRKRSTRSDSAIKFSLEAGNVNVVKQRVGEGCSFSREQSNYLQLRVDDPKEAEESAADKSALRKYERLRLDEARARNGNQYDSDNAKKSRNSISDIKWMRHPWFVTTEVSEYTVKPERNFNHASPFKSSTSKSKKTKNEAIFGESSSSLTTDGVQGRILPPCTRSAGDRSIGDRERKKVICEAETNPGGRRRLLSVQRLKDGKNGERRSRKTIS